MTRMVVAGKRANVVVAKAMIARKVVRLLAVDHQGLITRLPRMIESRWALVSLMVEAYS